MDGGPKCKNPLKQVAGDMNSMLVVLHIKGALICKSFTISRNWLLLKEVVPTARPQIQKPENVANEASHRCGFTFASSLFFFK